MSTQHDNAEYEYSGDCGSAKHGAISFHAPWCRHAACQFTMKVPVKQLIYKIRGLRNNQVTKVTISLFYHFIIA